MTTKAMTVAISADMATVRRGTTSVSKVMSEACWAVWSGGEKGGISASNKRVKVYIP